MPRLREGKLRLSRHYLDVLSALSESFNEGGEAMVTSLRRFSEERMQIEAAQRWASGQMDRNVLAAELTSEYCGVSQEFLNLVLTPLQRMSWYGSAVMAADILQRPDFKKKHLYGAALASFALGETARAVELSTQALGIASPEVSDAPHINLLAMAHYRMGDVAESANMVNHLQQAAEQERNDVMVFIAKIHRAVFQINSGQRHEAIDSLQMLLQESHQGKGRKHNRESVGLLGTACGGLGQLHRAEALLEEALRLNREAGDVSGEARSLKDLASVKSMAGDLSAAATYYEECTSILEKRNERVDLADVYWDRAIDLDHAGKQAEATAYIEKCYQIWSDSGDVRAKEALSQLKMRSTPMVFDCYCCWSGNKWFIEVGRSHLDNFLHVTAQSKPPSMAPVLSIDGEGIRETGGPDELKAVVRQAAKNWRPGRQVLNREMLYRMARCLGFDSSDCYEISMFLG